MGWEFDPVSGMGFYIDDQTGGVVTPVGTSGSFAPAPIQDVSSSPSGIIVPVDVGTGWGILPYSSAPHGVDIITAPQAGPVLPGQQPLPPVSYVVPRTSFDVPGIEPIDIKEVVIGYTPAPDFPYTPPVNIVSTSPTNQRPAYEQWLMLFVLMELTKRRRNN